MDGIDTMNYLRENVLTKDIPVIFLTALHTKKEEQAGGDVIANHVIMAKPFEEEHLLLKIKEMLND